MSSIILSNAEGKNVTLRNPDTNMEDIVIDLNNIQALPVGSFLNGYTIFNNCIVAFGGEFNRADYPKLWAYLQSNPSLVKTQTQWQTELITNDGICGFYSDGDGSTTFRVPNLGKAFLRPDSRGVGSFEADEFKSHSHGNVVLAVSRTTYFASGAFFNPVESISLSAGNTGGSETRPKNIAVLPLIVAK